MIPSTLTSVIMQPASNVHERQPRDSPGTHAYSCKQTIRLHALASQVLLKTVEMHMINKLAREVTYICMTHRDTSIVASLRLI